MDDLKELHATLSSCKCKNTSVNWPASDSKCWESGRRFLVMYHTVFIVNIS